jgi:hypothetical protein
VGRQESFKDTWPKLIVTVLLSYAEQTNKNERHKHRNTEDALLLHVLLGRDALVFMYYSLLWMVISTLVNGMG